MFACSFYCLFWKIGDSTFKGFIFPIKTILKEKHGQIGQWYVLVVNELTDFFCAVAQLVMLQNSSSADQSQNVKFILEVTNNYKNNWQVY